MASYQDFEVDLGNKAAEQRIEQTEPTTIGTIQLKLQPHEESLGPAKDSHDLESLDKQVEKISFLRQPIQEPLHTQGEKEPLVTTVAMHRTNISEPTWLQPVAAPAFQTDSMSIFPAALRNIESPKFAPLFTYPAPPPSSSSEPEHFAVGIDGTSNYPVRHALPRLWGNSIEAAEYSYGEAFPGRPVRVIERQKYCGGLLPCLSWDESYYGHIVDQEWQSEPCWDRSTVWTPQVLYYVSSE